MIKFYFKLILLVLLILLGVFGFYKSQSLYESVSSFLKRPLIGIGNISSLITSGEIKDIFISSASEMAGSNHLQFATLKQTEIFKKEEIRKYFNIKIGEASVQITLPVVYTYYLDLKGEWNFKYRKKDNLLLVMAPPIKTNLPAPNISLMNIIKNNSFFIDEKKLEREIINQLTDNLKEKAKKNISLITEIGKKETENFIRNFFIKEFSNKYEDYETLKNARYEIRFSELNVHPTLLQ